MKPKIILSGIVIFILACNSKRTSDQQQSPATNDSSLVFSGEYEYYAGAVGDGYLYYKMTLNQNSDDFLGTFFSGVYLNKTEQGYYTMPASMITSSLTGRRGNKNEVMIYLGAATNTSRIDSSYALPEPHKIFDEDANGDGVKLIFKKGNDYLWIVDGDTLTFSKPQKTKDK